MEASNTSAARVIRDLCLVSKAMSLISGPEINLTAL